MRLITFDSLTPVPWKNGGGITRQIAISPAGSDMGDDMGSFDWRISTAEVAQDGPFSRFEGVDRQLWILDGAGLELRFGSGERQRLVPGGQLAFPGEAEVHGALVGGPVSDLNVMVRRGRQRAHAEVRHIDGTASLDRRWPVSALFVREGQFTAQGASALSAGRHDTLLLEHDSPAAISLSGRAELLLIGFEALG